MGNTKDILSLILFCTFFTAYTGKLAILYKRDKIRANVLGKSNKPSDTRYAEAFVKATTFIWGAAWLVLSAAGDRAERILGTLGHSPAADFAGVIFTAAGVLIFILAMLSMGTSWRVGIDKTTSTRLVTRGIYGYSRNPAFAGFDLMFAGVLLMYPGILAICIFLLNIVSIHLLVLQEEKHLREMFGDDYIQYCRRVPRYIGIYRGSI